MKYTTLLDRDLGELILAERRGCAEAVCGWCRGEFQEPVDVVAAMVNSATPTGDGLWIHALTYQNGGRGAVKCEAGTIWARG